MPPLPDPPSNWHPVVIVFPDVTTKCLILQYDNLDSEELRLIVPNDPWVAITFAGSPGRSLASKSEELILIMVTILPLTSMLPKLTGVEPIDLRVMSLFTIDKSP